MDNKEALKDNLLQFRKDLIQLRSDTIKSIGTLRHSLRPKGQVDQWIDDHERYLVKNTIILEGVEKQLKNNFGINFDK